MVGTWGAGQPNFSFIDCNVRCLDGILYGRSLYISLPMARIFTQDEFASAIAHELAHFQNLGASVGLNIGEKTMRDNALPARAAVVREGELCADAVGAKATSAKTMAIALLKLRAFACTWHEMLQQMRETVSPDEKPMNLSEHWACRVSYANTATVLNGIDSERTVHPTDSHPSLSVRLSALNVVVCEHAADALQTAPSAPAIDLIANHETLEQELSEAVYRLLVNSTVKTAPLGEFVSSQS